MALKWRAHVFLTRTEMNEEVEFLLNLGRTLTSGEVFSCFTFQCSLILSNHHRDCLDNFRVLALPGDFPVLHYFTFFHVPNHILTFSFRIIQKYLKILILLLHVTDQARCLFYPSLFSSTFSLGAQRLSASWPLLK